MRLASLFGSLLAATLALFAPTAGAADFVFPQTGPCTSSYYSSRPYGIHGALDIAGVNRSAVKAARAGRVSFYGVSGDYGNLMIVTHEAGYTTYYGHLSGRAVAVGTSVSVGQTIAYEGMTGHATGPHVHFEVRRYGTKQYVPGSVGNRFTQGAGIGYDYPGIGATSTGGGGQGGGGTSSGPAAGAVRVSASALNVRSGPSTSYASIGLVYTGQVYVSSTTSSGWHEVWFGGRRGWASGSYLSRASGVTVHTVTASGLNVRTGPGTGYSVVNVAGNGQKYARSALSNGWAKIYYDGSQRWVSAQYTSTQSY